MQNRDFIICLVVVVIVSVIASLIGISIFQKPVLRAPPQEGVIQIPAITANVDVIIIDGTVVTGIDDTVIFSPVTVGNSYTTDVIPNNSNDDPFVVRNNGNVKINVDISESPGLFLDANSRLKFWVNHAAPYGTGGYASVDACLTNNPTAGCFNAATTPCTIQPNPTDNACVIPKGTPTRAINSFEFNDGFDETFLHILIFISNSEPPSAKSTIVTITGSQA